MRAVPGHRVSGVRVLARTRTVLVLARTRTVLGCRVPGVLGGRSPSGSAVLAVPMVILVASGLPGMVTDVTAVGRLVVRGGLLMPRMVVAAVFVRSARVLVMRGLAVSGVGPCRCCAVRRARRIGRRGVAVGIMRPGAVEVVVVTFADLVHRLSIYP
ncbi:MAG: hypothetical protein HOV79_33150 [Hamadaea sp.]|nr:hypothetical protein [Hamadaea sp.]